MPGCYVCGSIELSADADLRNPTCDECRPARDHVVSNRTGEGGAWLAVCQCGWRFQAATRGRAGNVMREAKVLGHWRAMIAASAASVAA